MSADMEHARNGLRQGEWSYACQCIRCRWEQWWHEGDNATIGMPEHPHPDGEYESFFRERERWRGADHPNGAS